MRSNPHIMRRLGVSLLAAVLLLLVLAGALVSCQTNATDALPRPLAVLPMPSPHGEGTAYGAVHPNGWAYIVNQGGSIAVLDGPQLVTLLPWPGGKPRAGILSGLDIDPKTGYVWVGDSESAAVHVISGTEVITTIHNLGVGPNHLVVHPVIGLVYVTNPYGYGPEPTLGTVTVISGTTVITTIETGYVPQVLRVHPLNQNVYVGHGTGWPDDPAGMKGLLSIINGTTRISQTTLGEAPTTRGYIMDIAINQKTGEIYMLQDYYALVYWDGQDDIRRLPLGKRGYFPDLDLSLNHVAVDTKRNWAYVTSWDGPPSHVIVVQKDKVIAVLEVPGYDVRDVVYDATHDYIYVANRLAGNMSIIRGTEVITTLNTGGVGPTYITVDERRGYIYVSNADTHSIAVFGYDAPPDGPPSFWRRFLPFLRR